MRPRLRITALRDLVLALAALAAVTLIHSRVMGVTNPTIVALTYLLVVLLVAALSPLWVAIVSSVLAVLATNYFFLPPVGTLTLADPQNWVVLIVLLVVSVTASQLASSARTRAREAIARRDEVSQLFDLSRDILLTTESAEAHQHLARSIARRFDLAYVAVCLPGADGWRLHEAGALSLTLPRGDLDEMLRAARGVIEFDARERTYGGHRTVMTSEGVRVDVVPLRLGGRASGLLASAGRPVDPGTLDALAGVAAIAVERTQFLDERKAAELARRSNELRSALLASLGHDLRTPLTAIKVAASNLHGTWLSEEERRGQAEVVLGEVERLSRLFQNILDMARIETSAVTAEREWVVADEIVEAAVAQVQHALGGHRLQVRVESQHAVQVDPRLTEAALAHLIENAAHYSPPGTTISIDATPGPDGLTIVVRDQGPGISEADLPRLFERFYRGSEAHRRSVGSGLGLAITRGLLAAEGGRVWAENDPAGGARFTIAVPAAVRPAPLEPGERP